MEERDPITRIADALEAIADYCYRVSNPPIVIKEPFVKSAGEFKKVN